MLRWKFNFVKCFTTNGGTGIIHFTLKIRYPDPNPNLLEKTWWANSRNTAAYVSKFLEVPMTHVVYSGAMFITGASYKSLISSLGIPSASAPLQPPDLRSIHTA